MVVLGGGCQWLLLVVVPTFTATLTLTPFLYLYIPPPLCVVCIIVHKFQSIENQLLSLKYPSVESYPLNHIR